MSTSPQNEALLVKNVSVVFIRRRIEASLEDWIFDEDNMPYDEESERLAERFCRAEDRLALYTDEQLRAVVLSDPNGDGIPDKYFEDVTIDEWIASVGEFVEP